jgi:hypothetical protein
MRTLIANYFVSTYPLGWKCSDCGKLFRVAVGVKTQPATPSSEISVEFGKHICGPLKVAAS